MALESEIDIKIALALDEAKNAKTFGELRKSIKDMKGIALQAGEGTDAFATMTDAIGSTTLKIRELNKEITAKSGPALKNMVGAFTNIGKTGFAAFETVAGAAALFGGEAEELGKQMVKLNAIMVLGRGLTEMSEASETLGRSFGILKSQVMDFYKNANNATGIFIQQIRNITFKDIFTELQQVGSAIIGAFSNPLPAIEKFFMTIKTLAAANPLGVIILAILTITAVLAAMFEDFKPLKMLFDGIKAVVMGVIGAVKDFLDWLGLTHFALNEQTKTTIDNADKQKKAIESRYDREIAIAKATGDNVELLELKKSDAIMKTTNIQIGALKKLEENGVELNKDQKKQLEDFTKIVEEENLKMDAAAAKALKSMKDFAIKEEKIRVDHMKDGAAKRKEETKLIKNEENLTSDEKRKSIEDEFKLVEANRVKNKNAKLKALDDAASGELKSNNDELISATNYGKKKQDVITKYDNEHEANTKVRNEALVALNSEHNETVGKNTRDSNANEIKAAKELSEKKKKIDEDIIKGKIANAEVYSEFKVLDAERTNKTDADKLALDLKNIEGEEGFTERKKFILDSYYEKTKGTNDELIKSDQEVYKYKRELLEYQMKGYKKDSQEYKDLCTQIDKLGLERAQKEEKYNQISIADFKTKTEELTALWKKEHEGKLDQDATNFKADLSQLEEEYGFQVKLAGDNESKLLEIKNKYQIEKSALEREYNDKVQSELDNFNETKKEKEKENLTSWENSIKAVAASIGAALVSMEQMQIDSLQREISAFNKAQDDKLAKLQQANAQSTQDISDTQAIQLANFAGSADDKAKLETRYAQDKIDRDNAANAAAYALQLEKYKFDEDMGKRVFESNKKMQYASAVISGALAVANGLATQPFIPAGVIAGSSAAIAAGLSIAKISQTSYQSSGNAPLPPVHLNSAAAGLGSMSNSTTGNSAAAPRAQTMFRLGQGGPGAAGGQGGGDQRVYVVESDITKVQNRVSVIQARASKS